MTSADHVLDPDGDMTIVLKNPGAPFKVTQSLWWDGVPHPERKKEVTFLVSSKHLSLGSNYFRRALQGPWAENCTDGMKRFEAHDWEESTFLLVLCAIHGRMHGIRLSFNLDTLVDVARVVNYYQCSEAAFVLVGGNMDDFSNPWTRLDVRDRVLEIFIFFAFNMAEKFLWATNNCILYSHDVVFNVDAELGLPDEIVGMYWRLMQVNGLLLV